MLVHPITASAQLPLLLAVTKTDAGAACHSTAFVLRRLEKEMYALAQSCRPLLLTVSAPSPRIRAGLRVTLLIA